MVSVTENVNDEFPGMEVSEEVTAEVSDGQGKDGLLNSYDKILTQLNFSLQKLKKTCIGPTCTDRSKAQRVEDSFMM